MAAFAVEQQNLFIPGGIMIPVSSVSNSGFYVYRLFFDIGTVYNRKRVQIMSHWFHVICDAAFDKYGLDIAEDFFDYNGGPITLNNSANGYTITRFHVQVAPVGPGSQFKVRKLPDNYYNLREIDLHV